MALCFPKLPGFLCQSELLGCPALVAVLLTAGATDAFVPVRPVERLNSPIGILHRSHPDRRRQGGDTEKEPGLMLVQRDDAVVVNVGVKVEAVPTFGDHFDDVDHVAAVTGGAKEVHQRFFRGRPVSLSSP